MFRRVSFAMLMLSAIAVACSLVETGCGRSSAGTIAVIPRTTGSTLWEAEHAGAEMASKLYKCQIYWNAPTREDDVESQIALLERVRLGHFDGVVLAPDHALALLTSVQKIVATGIPVVIVSSPLTLPASKNLSYVLNDDEMAGRLAAGRLAKTLSGKGSVAILGVDSDVTGILAKMKSLEGFLQSHYPGIKVTMREPGAFNAAEAQQATLAALSSSSKVDALVALTAVSTRAAYFTLSGTHQLLLIKLVGFEQDREMTEHIATGEIDSIIAEDTLKMGFTAVEQIIAQRSGKPTPPRTLLPPIVITSENVNSAKIKRLISMDALNAQ